MARKKRTDGMGHVLRNGEMQRADGQYMYRYNNLIGQRKTVYAPSLVELRDKEENIQRDLRDGIDTSKGDMTLNQLFRMYMDTKTNLRDSTRFHYNAMWKDGVENTTLGNMSISKIKQFHVRAFYKDLVDRGYAEGTIKSYHELIHPALEMAVDNDMIRKNPAKDCVRDVGGTKKEKRALTREEQDALVDYVTGEYRHAVYAPLIEFALATGLRFGEMAGLLWSDVDMEKKVIHIRRQLIYKNVGDGRGYHYKFQELKTKAGVRDIPLTDTIRKSLLDQKKLVFAMGIKPKETEGASDFIFLGLTGKPLNLSSFNESLGNIVKDYNMEHPEGIRLPRISAHILRHTACTRLAESGMEPKVLQYIMGHTNIAMTMDVYTHIDFAHIQEDMERVQQNMKVV